MTDDFVYPLEDAVECYLREVRRIPLLSQAEETELIARIAASDPDDQAKKRLMEAHLMMAVEIAGQYESREVHLLDLVQQGNMGLIEATKVVRPGALERFAVYASGFVHRAIEEFIARPRINIMPPHLQ